MNLARLFLWFLLFVVLCCAVVWYPVNWDEGWTFCAGRHLFESANFGCKINGSFTSARLVTSWPTVVMASSGFALFGINHIAGRALFGLAAFACVILLGRLFGLVLGRRHEVLTLLVLLLISGDPRVHPMLLGAQAWGEIPALLLFLIGATILRPCLTAEDTFSFTRWMAAFFFWELSIITKFQFGGFICAGLSAGGLLLLSRGAWRQAFGLLLFAVFLPLVNFLLPFPPMPYQDNLDQSGTGSLGWSAVLGAGFDWSWRSRTATIFWFLNNFWGLLWCYPVVLLTFGKGGSKWLSDARPLLILGCFSCAAIGWFLLCAPPFPRYAAPAILVSTGFFADAILKLSTTTYVKFGRFSVLLSALLRRTVITALIVLGVLNGCTFFKHIHSRISYNSDLYETVRWLENTVEKNGLVFTYDSQLFFLLDIAYTYPPDIMHRLPKEQQDWSFDITSKRPPTWLVIGDWSELFGISAKSHPDFELVKKFGDFAIYRSTAINTASQ